MSSSPAAWQPACRATRLIFLVIGIANASWAVMVPYAKLRLNLDDAVLGSILLTLGCGAMLAMPLTSMLLKHWGSAQVIRVAGVAMLLVIPALVLAPSALLLAGTLFIFGALIGVLDVSINDQAVVVENMAARPLMSSFHGLFSVGGLIGGAALAGLLKSGLSLLLCAVVVGVLCALLSMTQFGALVQHTERPASEKKSHLAFNNGAVLLIGALCFCAFLTEGAMLDWGAVFLHFERGVSEASAGIGYAAFSVAMAVGRLTGDRVVRALGPFKVVLAGGLTAAIGMGVIVTAPWAWLSLVGFVLVGLGASNVVPVLFGAASRVRGVDAAAALPTIIMMGYTGMLAGPALVGYAARATSLPLAFGGVGLLMLFVAINARSMRNTAHPASTPQH
ncbi:MFS transporter [Amantichitinum ursilacus]|uniref:Inner membrane protein YbjJ n=1 Tax=Amantichitinum ursilacus TaxID=857265 RepID=A0A0N1JTQ0_9NEIS|nr:MFS transporter [Amantichitinum ursilacus]KPC54726.1 Inner membrane protein YbjJ [Amantichitinum ursilacus]